VSAVTSSARPTHPALIVNPRSGDGTAARADLVSECRTRGIEPVVFETGDDLTALATTLVMVHGADIIGMAGGDGSQAAVAAVAAAYDVPYVCIPAGTRNHFALDVGVDRLDVLGALDAFFDGLERRIDLGRVNGRVFVNNVSMGMYGHAVQMPQYREAKMRTLLALLPDLHGPGGQPDELHFAAPDGRTFRWADVLLVSNGRYDLRPHHSPGSRRAMNDGTLGVVAVVGPPPHGLIEWTTPTFQVGSTTSVPAGIDGEGIQLTPPLLFESLASALRLRIPARARRRAGYG
jgi:diacylglycerol kinase family enzyme